MKMAQLCAISKKANSYFKIMVTLTKRIIKTGLTAFQRQLGLNSATIFVLTAMILLFTFIFFVDGMSNFLFNSFQEKVGISVYFKQDTSAEDISALKEEVAQKPGVTKVVYVSKEEALEKFKQNHLGDDIILKTLEIVGDNPLAAEIKITADSDSSYKSVAEFLAGEENSAIIQRMSYQKTEEIIKKLFAITREVKKIGLIMGLFFGLIVVVIVFSTVRLSIHTLREEIGVMKLVGASNWMVRGPFMVQGILCGSIAAVISLILTIVTTYFATPSVVTITGGFSLFGYFSSNLWAVLAIQILGGIGMGIIFNALAVKKYLKV